MADEAHSLFSASGADGWSVCHGKPAMEEGRKSSSEYADEGTAAHTLASWVMEARIHPLALPLTTASDYLGEEIAVTRWDAKLGKSLTRTFTVDQEMAEHVDTYVDQFFAMSEGATVERFCEQRVNYSAYLGAKKDQAWGTSDGIAILYNQPELEWEGPNGVIQYFPPGDEIQVHDLKYGAGVMVFADTLQTFCYGAGSFWEWEHVLNCTRVRLVIHQPRKDHVSELVVTPKQLLDTVRALSSAVPRVVRAYELAKTTRGKGHSDLEVGEYLHEQGFLVPSEKGCRFCDGRAVCPALAAEVALTVGNAAIASPMDFDDLTVDSRADVREYGANYLAAAFARLPLIEDWMKAVRAEIDNRVLNRGEKFDGLKVVAGKKGPRSWTDKGRAEALAMSLPPALKALAFKQELKTPAQIMDKAFKTSPSTAAKFARLIEQKDGKKAVVPISDARKPVANRALAEDFDDLTEEDVDNMPSVGVRSGYRDPHPFR